MDTKEYNDLYKRLKEMSQEEKLLLDPIVRALEFYQSIQHSQGGRISPNRIVALAAVDVMNRWEQAVWERD